MYHFGRYFNLICACKWFSGFMKRHKKSLAERKPSNISVNRAVPSNPVKLDSWFQDVQKIFEQHNFNSKPLHVFNCDESCLQCTDGWSYIICRRVTKTPKQLGVNNEK